MSGSRVAARLSLVLSLILLVVGVAGFVISLVVNVFLADQYNAYGEVSIPGSGTVHLPAGQVTANFHATVTSGPNSGSLPVPRLKMGIDPPAGAAPPTVTENEGGTTTVNNDSHVRIWQIQIAADGDYAITTDGDVNGYINPRLAFGHSTSYGYLVWLFVGVFAFGLVYLVVSVIWVILTRRRKPPFAPPYAAPAGYAPQAPYPPPPAAPYAPQAPYPPPPAVPYAPPPPPVATTTPEARQAPTDDAIKAQQIKTLTSLRDSGALTPEEFETEKRRILDGR
jgi:Short C-terminal domain